MNLTTEMIVALSGLLTGIAALSKTFWDARQNAIEKATENRRVDKRDEVALLRDEVRRLHDQIVEMQESNRKREEDLTKRLDEADDENAKLKKRVALLEATLISHGIDIPKEENIGDIPIGA